MSPERTAELLERMETFNPPMHRRLLALKERRPMLFNRAMQRVDEFVRRLEALPPDVRAKLLEQRQTRLERLRWVRAYHAAGDPRQREKIRREIETLTGRIFDADQQLKEHKLRELAEAVARLGEELKRRAERRDELIAEDTRRLLAAPPDPEGAGPDGSQTPRWRERMMDRRN